jgi:Zn-dependent protease
VRSINTGVGARYSITELRDIGISVLVLSVAFAIMFRIRDIGGGIFWLFVVSAVIVCASFVAHEMAHKFVAQRFGAWAEYRMFPFGLMLALLMSFFGVIFAAPGVVYVSGQIDRQMNGKISAAGPAINIILGSAALGLALLTSGSLSTVFWIRASINAFFAVFNRIPVMPFDGSKIYRGNVSAYLVMLTMAIALLASVLLL